MFDGGYIRLYRSLLNWEWYSDINTKTLFIHLLLTVNHKDEQWCGITIKRGQRTTSIVKLSCEIRLTERQTRTALSHLIMTNEVTNSTTAKYTLITVNNYDKYQTATNETPNYRQANDTQNDTLSDELLTNYRQTTANNIINTRNKRSIKNIKEKEYMPDAEQDSAPSNPQITSITLNDKTEFPIFQNQVTNWSELYPAVDILQELRNMKGWLDANPSKRKTRTGALRFVNYWLSTTQNKGGTKGYEPSGSVFESGKSKSINTGGIVL